MIPTLNCRDDLRRSLTTLRAQRYPARIRVFVMDGGSTDGSVAAAAEFGAETRVVSGQYGTGLNGSRHLGEMIGTAPLVWILDSDNFLVGPDVASQLSRPFEQDPSVQLSVPALEVSLHQPGFNRWLALTEQSGLEQQIAHGEARGGWYRVPDLSHGISNGTIIRRSTLATAGGYDSDVRLLVRLRRMGLSCAAIVPSARIVHRQANSVVHYVRKASRRIRRFSQMSNEDLKSYFVDFPIPKGTEEQLQTSIRRSVVFAPISAIRGLRRSRDTAWLWGLGYPFVVLAIVSITPRDAWRVYSRFL